jgi:hypothetical protein
VSVHVFVLFFLNYNQKFSNRFRVHLRRTVRSHGVAGGHGGGGGSNAVGSLKSPSRVPLALT